MSAQPTGTESAEASPPLLRDPCVIAVVCQKGGVGKTTTVVNLAAALAGRGLRVCVVDLDTQGSASHHLGHDAPHAQNLLDALERAGGLAAAPTSTLDVDLVAGGEGVELMSADKYTGRGAKMMRLRRVLESSRVEGALTHDVVIIDTPPHLELATRSAVWAADWVIAPMQAEPAAMQGLRQTLDFVDDMRVDAGVRLLGTLLTFHDRRGSLSEEMLEKLTADPRACAFGTTIPRNTTVARAFSHGVPAIVHDPRAPGAVAYEDLADEVLRRIADGHA